MLENFIYTKEKSLFEEALNNGEVLDEAIVFIEDTKEIWNHGTYFDGSTFDPSNIEASIAKLEEEVDEINFILVDAGGSAEEPDVPVYPSDLENYVTEEELEAKSYATTETLNLAVQSINSNINSFNQSINTGLQNVNEKANKADTTATSALNLAEGIQGNLSTFALKTDLEDYITTTDAHNYTDTAIANLVDSAPETLNTLNELATAISEHQDVTDALNAAISNKADKTEIPTKVSQLENDANYITNTEVADSYLVKGDYALKSDVEVEIKLPNVVYAVTVDGELIDYNTADATATGVALIAGEHKFMIAKADNATSTTLYWGKNLYGKDVAGVVNNGKVDGTNDYGYLAGTSTPQLNKDFTTWTAGALSDFDGKANTAAIIAGYTEHGVSMDARDMCSALNTFNASDSYNDWYVPACGQLALMYLNKTEINEALTKIGGTALAHENYWSSSESSSNGAWDVGFYNGLVSGGTYKRSNSGVRFVRDLTTTTTTIKKPLKEKVTEIGSSVSELLSNVYTKEEIDSMLSISKFEWVDLGLPSGLKWASCNVGAEKPEDFGLYFAWGETEGYEGITDEKQFSWADYKFSIDGSSSNFSKYNSTDTLTTLEQVDDAAYVSDNTCRMPTKADFEELTANTTNKWETLNGVNGRRFTSKTNGNSIFVPAAGYCSYGPADNVGSYGSLWSSSLIESRPSNGWCLGFDSGVVGVGDGSPCDGFSVRAVQEANTNTKFNPLETVSKVSELEEHVKQLTARIQVVTELPENPDENVLYLIPE